MPYPCAFSIINDRAIDSKITDTNSNSYEVGEILNIDNKSLVATRDKFIELGVIDDGEKTEQFKEYAYGGGIQEQKVLNWLLRVYKRLFYGKKNKFDRGLPFGDCFVDRWEKAKSLGFGEGTSIYDNVLGDVKVCTNTWIGPNVILDGSGGLEIGSNCSISADSVNWSISGGKESYEYH